MQFLQYLRISTLVSDLYDRYRMYSFQLDPSLKEYAELNKEIIVAGVGDHFEIWSREKWVEEMKNIDSAEPNVDFDQLLFSDE